MRSPHVVPTLLLLAFALACTSGRAGTSVPDGGDPAPGSALAPPDTAPASPLPLLPPPDADPGERDRALLATWSRCGRAPVGRQALVVLASGALDPTRGGRDPDLAATAAAAAVESEPRGSWLRPVAEALYLSARELGGEVRPARLPGPPSEPGAGCEAEAQPAAPPEPPVALPALRDTAMAVRLERLRAEVDRLRRLLGTPDEP